MNNNRFLWIISLAYVPFFLAADKKETGKIKVPYYIVNLHNTGLSGGKDILVPKSCFDAAIKTYYLIEHQKQVYGYEKKLTGFDIVDIVFTLKPDHNYGPALNKTKFIVNCSVYATSAMEIGNNQLKSKFQNKHEVLKYIEDNTEAQIKKDSGYFQDLTKKLAED